MLVTKPLAAGGTALVLTLLVSLPHALRAEDSAGAEGSPEPAPESTPVEEETDAGVLPELIVSGLKTPASLKDAPLSETAVPYDTLRSADVRVIQDVVKFAPNTVITEFSARKLSNPRFRGIGSSPLNPAITTYIDGVPILNANAANLNFLNVGQIEFVRGPQSTLFGRNNLAGVILVDSLDPKDYWTAQSITSVGDYSLIDTRATVSGPLTDNLGVALSGGYESRDGYSTNDLTGHDVDYRESGFGKVQFLFQPTEDLTLRLNVLGESSDDGDYALQDLASLREHPYHVSRDYEGYTQRDLALGSFELLYEGDGVDFTSTSGYLWWNTVDSTDLDYTPLPLIRRYNEEEGNQFTQEFRLSSPAEEPLVFNPNAELHWQTGLFFFTQHYEQEAINHMSPLVTGLPFTLLDATTAELDDWGLGVYAHGTLRLCDFLDLTAGVRADYEEKEATLGAYTSPAFSYPTLLDLEDDFVAVSPTFAVGIDVTDNVRLYGSIARGYKAGGFNGIFHEGGAVYDEETSWNYEGGVKTTWLDGRVRANAAFFYTSWDDLQLNVPVLNVPGRFYVDNVGQAATKGFELDLQVQPTDFLAAYVAFGLADTEFLSGSESDGVSIAGNDLPYSPEYTVSTGAELSFPLNPSGLELFARADIAIAGRYAYDASNVAGQDSYALADFRLGVRHGRWFLEGWVRNAFDEDYVPTAIPYTLAASGYVGENGAPTTFGLRFGLTF